MKTKKCKYCAEEKDLKEFHLCKRAKDGHESVCKSCRYIRKQKQREYYKKHNKEKVAQQGKRERLKRKYGLTLEKWQEMYDRFEGRCFICHRKMKVQGTKGLRPTVDHSHYEDGKVRTLICCNCNMSILPPFERDHEMALRVYEYLKTDWNNGRVPLETRRRDHKKLKMKNKPKFDEEAYNALLEQEEGRA